MALKYLSLILFSPLYLYGSDCSIGYVKIEEVCYNKIHIDVLQDFIDLNPSLSSLQPQNIGYQEWTNDQLTYLYLGDNNIVTLPDSIGLLKGLINLDLRKNQINFLPKGICNVYPFYTDIILSGNQICPPYPYCFDYLSNQDIKNCEGFSCPQGYMEVDGECYYKEHMQILQSIIDVNPSLKDLAPLDLGKDIGYQGWENGKLVHLNLVSNRLTALPENLCSIYSELEYFIVSNNFICPPYPKCFAFMGDQNTEDCNPLDYIEDDNIKNNYVDNRDIIPASNIFSINFEYFQGDIDILKDFIEKNESLTGKNPLEIGIQKWGNMRLTYLDLSESGITYVPLKLCDIYSNLNFLDMSNNAICPPYPKCIEYIGKQKTELCGSFTCPENYIEIDGQCYHSEHISFLETLFDSNATFLKTSTNLQKLEIAFGLGLQEWKNGKIAKLVLTGTGLTIIPENICNIYHEISVLDISNNAICPPYPKCLENTGYQDLDSCKFSDHHVITLSCPIGYVSFDDKCYYYEDLQFLIDITKSNPVIQSHHPLLLGYQLWENGRLLQLNLDGWSLSIIPESVQRLDQLEYLNLNNNQLTTLPESLCDIYSNLQNFHIDNNLLCSPYLDCFDFIGKQNTENCDFNYCPHGYTEIDKECYYKKDVSVLQDFISLNESLNDRSPLEIGIQKWENKRLNFLYLGVNQLTTIPESICTIASNLKTLNISQNSLCPPYPDCVEDFVGEQNTSSCP